MQQLFHTRHRLIFYGFWLLLGLVQSGLTELLDDEAYYWVYGQYLDWGYFDHPPMIGLLVKAGYSIFPNELGVRLFPLLLNVFSLVIIEKLIDKKNPFLFYAIVLSIAVLQVTGFAAVPDIPLIFFTALFFWLYKRFIGNYSLLNTFLLGLSVALLLYSKYHAILIVFFTFLSNIKLITKYQTYLAGIIALLLFAPHLWWQYQHNWVSFRYHLFESNVNPYKPSFTLDYIIYQLILPGPVAGFILLPAAVLYKTKNDTEKALRFTMIGIYAFFFISSFRGRVEGNWTSPVIVPLIVLAHQFLYEKVQWQKTLYKLLPVTLILVVFARTVMIVDLLPIKIIKDRYHAWKEWPGQMKEKTNDLPVVFSSSYQRTSKYWFYSGQPAYSLNSYQWRKNNYNFWPIEDSLLGKEVYFLDKYDLYRFTDSLKTSIGWIGYKYDSSFISFAKVNIEVSQKKVRIREGAAFTLDCTFAIPEYYGNFIRKSANLHDTIRIGVYQSGKWKKDIYTSLSLKEMVEQKRIAVIINPGLAKGNYFLRFAINSGYRNATHNSEKIKLIVN